MTHILSFAANPPICCCSVWPAHSPPIHQFGVVLFGRRIPRQDATDLALFHLAGAFPADSVSSFASAFTPNPLILCCSIWLAHPLAGPPLGIASLLFLEIVYYLGTNLSNFENL